MPIQNRKRRVSDVRKMYYTLFQAIADAMELIEGQNYQEALTRLELASQETEQTYITQ